MKIASVLAGLSLAANGVLLAILAFGVASDSRVAPAAGASAIGAASVPAAQRLSADAWAKLETDDLPAHVARLQAEGFPPAMLRAIVAARVHKEYAARRKAIEGDELPYWIVNRDPKQQAELSALAREEAKRLRDLLGPDPEDGTAARLARSLPNLPPEKIAAIAEIRDRANEKRSEIYSVTRSAMLPEDAAQLDAIEKAARAEIATVLTPQELEEYDYRQSTTANRLRNTLTAFDATEAEYRTIFKLQSAFDTQFGNLAPGMSQEVYRARSEAQKGLNEQIKIALGDARYADYTRATDYNYRRSTQLVARLNLPPETANELYAIQQDAQQRMNELRRTPPGPGGPVERIGQMQALAADAETKIGAKLGPAGLEAYKQNGGTWLTNLAPRMPPPRK